MKNIILVAFILTMAACATDDQISTTHCLDHLNKNSLMSGGNFALLNHCQAIGANVK